MIDVLPLSDVTLSDEPKCSSVTSSNVNPNSDVIKVAPVKAAISFKISVLSPPKPGALTAKHFNVPLAEFTTIDANASPCTS